MSIKMLLERFKLKFFTQSLQNKIVLLTSFSAFTMALILSGIHYNRTSEITVNRAIEGLASETNLMSVRFKSKYDEIRNDVEIISNTPPIEGMIRSYKNNGIDPKDGSTIELWKSRLSVIFQSIMKTNQEYDHIRFIGVRDGGREIVRVNRDQNGSLSYRVKNKNLQRKAKSQYFQTAVKRSGEGFLFSKLTYNKEFGKKDARRLPTLRGIMPVFDKDKLFGFIIINVDYRALISNTFRELAPNKDVYIISDSGDYIEYDRGNKVFDLKLRSDYEDASKIITKLGNIDKEEDSFIENHTVYYVKKLFINNLSANQEFIEIALSVPYKDLMRDVQDIRKVSLIIAIIVILLSLFLNGIATRKMISPLKKMTLEITKKSRKKKSLDLPVDMSDEIGELAKAFAEKTEDLIESEGKVRTILNNVVDGIITMDKSGFILSFNNTCEKMFGYQEGEVIGKDFRMLFEDKEISMSSLSSEGIEMRGISKDKKLLDVEFSVSSIKSVDNNIFCGIIRDITKRKQIEKLKDEFISTINHELRTPLTSIQGSLGLLNNQDNLDSKSKKLVQLSYLNCERLLYLVNDILDMEKIAAGKMEYYLKEVEISSLIDSIKERYKGYAMKYRVSLVVKKEIDEVYCNVDPIRLSQALGNLLSNAVKYSKKGSKVIIKLFMKSSRRVQISVIDRGEGVADEFKDKIFDKFSREDSSSTRQRGGTGLGLNITKSIIENFNGKIDFKSNEGKGSEFFIILPIIVKPKK